MPHKEEKKSVEELERAELEEIHRQLYWNMYSDEARAYLVLKVVGKVDVSKERITEAIELYEEAGRFGDAGEIARRAGMTEKAIEIHEKAGAFDDAVDVAEKAGMTKLAAGICCKAGWFVDAAEIAERAGATELARGFSAAAEQANWPFW